MPSKTKPADYSMGIGGYDHLAADLIACDNTADLFKLANDPAFGTAAKSLPSDDLKRLRALYVDRKTALDGKVKLEQFAGQVISVVDITYWHTDKFGGKDGVTLTYIPEGTEQTYRSLTTSDIVHRWAAAFTRPPTRSDPARVLIELVPVRDAARAAEGQKQWRFRSLPTPTRDNGEEGSPF